MSRVFYPISISFTVSGFYSTDYGQGKQKPESETAAGESVKVVDKRAKKTDEKTTKKREDLAREVTRCHRVLAGEPD